MTDYGFNICHAASNIDTKMEYSSLQYCYHWKQSRQGMWIFLLWRTGSHSDQCSLSVIPTRASVLHISVYEKLHNQTILHHYWGWIFCLTGFEGTALRLTFTVGFIKKVNIREMGKSLNCQNQLLIHTFYLNTIYLNTCWIYSMDE